MTKFKITRTWIVEAKDMYDALQKTKNWNHEDTHIIRLSKDHIGCLDDYYKYQDSYPSSIGYESSDYDLLNPTYEVKEPWKDGEVFKIISENPLRIVINPKVK